MHGACDAPLVVAPTSESCVDFLFYLCITCVHEYSHVRYSILNDANAHNGVIHVTNRRYVYTEPQRACPPPLTFAESSLDWTAIQWSPSWSFLLLDFLHWFVFLVCFFDLPDRDSASTHTAPHQEQQLPSQEKLHAPEQTPGLLL